MVCFRTIRALARQQTYKEWRNEIQLRQIFLRRWCRIHIPLKRRYWKRRKTYSISFQKVWTCRTRGKQNEEEWQIKNGSNVFPGAGRKEDATTIDKEADIMIREQEFYSYTKKFKYLGSICTPSLKDDEDIKRRISQACGAFAQAEKLLCNHKLQAITRIWFYKASV